MHEAGLSAVNAGDEVVLHQGSKPEVKNRGVGACCGHKDQGSGDPEGFCCSNIQGCQPEPVVKL